MPMAIGTGPDQIPVNGMLGKQAFKDFDDIESHANVAPTIASAATISPVAPITFVSGSAAIDTITPPQNIVGGGKIVLIPTGAWTTVATGNVAIASAAVSGKAMTLYYDSGAAKWYPSY